MAKVIARKNKGVHSEGESPLPIPNRVVKPLSADGTAVKCGRVGHCLFLKVFKSNLKDFFYFRETSSAVFSPEKIDLSMLLAGARSSLTFDCHWQSNCYIVATVRSPTQCDRCGPYIFLWKNIGIKSPVDF